MALDLGKGADYAEPIFLKVVELDRNYAKAYFSLGGLYLAKNDCAKSEKWLKEFVRLSPNDSVGYFTLAIAQHQNPKEALRSLELALQKNFKDYARLKNEPKFALLRKQSGYKNLVKKYFPGKE